MDNSRAQWGSKLGFILAAAGSAIGLGNIWKFPGRAFEGGGGTYVLIYLCMVIFLGAPLMLTELSIGRASQANVVGAFRNLGHKRWSWVGWVGVIGAFIITCYYSHVGGWVLRYVYGYAVEAPTIYADPLGYFYATLGLGADGNTLRRALHGLQRRRYHPRRRGRNRALQQNRHARSLRDPDRSACPFRHAPRG